MSDKEKQISDIEKNMQTNYSYPDVDDPHIQYKLYKKRELYYNRIPERPSISKTSSYQEIKEYRDNICGRDFTLHEHQGMLSNLINPDTPYRGILIFHGLGSGKCVEKHTEISVNDNTLTFEAIWNNYSTTITTDETNGEWSVPNETLYITSILGGDQAVEKPIKHLYREKVNTHLRLITLTSGETICITFAHKLLTALGWTTQLCSGLEVCCYDESRDAIYLHQIQKIDTVMYNDYVYDIEIEDTHNYVVKNGIICHNTCVGISIAEKFKHIVQKYNTKIYILVPGPFIKESWKYHLLFCTGETYKKLDDKHVYLDDEEKKRRDKQALASALQYYKIMSYRSFYKRVLGEKIADKKVVHGAKVRTTYRKTSKGDFERDIAVDRIYNLNNTLIIADEAHNLTKNFYGKALQQVIASSFNLKVVLMTATPMKNYGSDIVELINFLRPADAPMQRDLVFNSQKNHLMDFCSGGLEYFKKMINGYVSHVRGADPLTFAKRVDKGVVPEGLLFIPMIRCNMLEFQRQTYDGTTKVSDDALDRKSEAVANFVFPGLTKDRTGITGYYGREGLAIIREQLKSVPDILNEKIAETFFDKNNDEDALSLSADGTSITGKIFKLPFLKIFSIKFYKALKKINRLVAGKKGAKTAFVYSNLVKVGIELFQEILLQNGYLEFQEDEINYHINDTTVCYYCGKTYKTHKFVLPQEGGANNIKVSESSSDYEKSDMVYHKFSPATFITITGKSDDEKADVVQEDKKRVLDTFFNSMENKEGKFIKLVLGSRVINEGVNMKNVGEVHILDVYFNLGKVDQAIGRAIRWCSHYKVTSEKNPFPEVPVYKYVISLGKNGGLSSEEELYKKAEMKYILIKKLERAMKENAIDCPLNMNANIFNEEIEEFKDCEKHRGIKCPAICDYQKCFYKCDDQKLNIEYYDPNRNLYKLIPRKDLDYSTFTQNFARSEIDFAKSKIKDMYVIYPMYTLKEIVEHVKNMYSEEKKDLFDDFFVYKALDELIPITENDFNVFKDTIIDKYNTPGYLIYRDKYYIFQPFNQNENIPLVYRTENIHNIVPTVSLYNYLKNVNVDKKLKQSKKTDVPDMVIEDVQMYNFDDTLEYYDGRQEYNIVGIIDKEISRRKNRRAGEIHDVFKIREKLPKVLLKKRGTGIPSIKGAVCSTSKSIEYLEKIAKKLGIKCPPNITRFDLCALIEKDMMLKEKYGTDVDSNKFTYVRLPANHPKYPFPYNLEDRVKFIINKIKQTIKYAIDITTKSITKKEGDEKGLPSYIITIKHMTKLDEYTDFLSKLGATKNDKEWTITVE